MGTETGASRQSKSASQSTSKSATKSVPKTESRSKSSPGESDDSKATSHIDGLLDTHAGWLKTLVTALVAVGFQPVPALLVLLVIYTALLITSPSSFLAFFTPVVTLLVPAQSTVRAMTMAIASSSGASEDAGVDTPQWIVYWLVFTAVNQVRGWVSVFRPKWIWFFQIWTQGLLIALGGGWFARSVMRPRKRREPEKPDEAEVKPKTRTRTETEAKDKAKAKDKATPSSKASDTPRDRRVSDKGEKDKRS